MTPVRSALVLAAGHGRRLWPLTAVRAKPALPVGGRPLITHILTWLAASGIDRVVVNLHHRPTSITSIVGDGRAFGVSVRYSWERRLLGSAGGPRHALPLLDETFFIVNGDTLTDVDLAALAARHGEAGALVTMAVMPSPDPAKYGGVVVEHGMVARFARPGTAADPWHFVGVQIAHREAFAALADDTPAESVWGHYPAVLREMPRAIAAFPCRPRFHDIGSLDDYVRTSRAFAEERDAWHGSSCRIADDAVIHDSILWDDVVVEPGARLERCIVTDGVRVAAGRHCHDVILLPPATAALLPEAHLEHGVLVVARP